MDTKLTLKLNEDIIEKAKSFAKSKKISLSGLIENYLQKLVADENKEEKITPLVKSLSGIIDFPKDYNHKDSYTDFLMNKYK